MDERRLTPATDEDLIQSLAFALRYNRSGKRVSDRDVMTSTMAAEHLVSMLKLSGYVVMKGPPAPAHSAPPPPHAHLYDQIQTADEGVALLALIRCSSNVYSELRA